VSDRSQKVRLLFVDEGAYHRETVSLPLDDLDQYDRLIDYLREDPALLRRVYVDADRLCAAYLIDGSEDK
jgi:hypothetical protein